LALREGQRLREGDVACDVKRLPVDARK
jgi:hypothetical protein